LWKINIASFTLWCKKPNIHKKENNIKQSESALMNAKALKQQNSSYNFSILNPILTTQIKVNLRNKNRER
jgi:hypothetical protein